MDWAKHLLDSSGRCSFGDNMKFSSMRKETLVKWFHRLNFQLANPQEHTVAFLRTYAETHFKTYLEDWFDRRIRHLRSTDPAWALIKQPGRNRRLLPGSNLEFDFSWISRKVAVEIQGGIDSRHRRSGHVSPEGMRRDMHKVNAAQLNGWYILQFAPEHIACDHTFHSYTKPYLFRALQRHQHQWPQASESC